MENAQPTFVPGQGMATFEQESVGSNEEINSQWDALDLDQVENLFPDEFADDANLAFEVEFSAVAKRVAQDIEQADASRPSGKGKDISRMSHLVIYGDSCEERADEHDADDDQRRQGGGVDLDDGSQDKAEDPYAITGLGPDGNIRCIFCIHKNNSPKSCPHYTLLCGAPGVYRRTTADEMERAKKKRKYSCIVDNGKVEHYAPVPRGSRVIVRSMWRLDNRSLHRMATAAHGLASSAANAVATERQAEPVDDFRATVSEQREDTEFGWTDERDEIEVAARRFSVAHEVRDEPRTVIVSPIR